MNSCLIACPLLASSYSTNVGQSQFARHGALLQTSHSHTHFKKQDKILCKCPPPLHTHTLDIFLREVDNCRTMDENTFKVDQNTRKKITFFDTSGMLTVYLDSPLVMRLRCSRHSCQQVFVESDQKFNDNSTTD